MRGARRRGVAMANAGVTQASGVPRIRSPLGERLNRGSENRSQFVGPVEAPTLRSARLGVNILWESLTVTVGGCISNARLTQLSIR